MQTTNNQKNVLKPFLIAKKIPEKEILISKNLKLFNLKFKHKELKNSKNSKVVHSQYVRFDNVNPSFRVIQNQAKSKISMNSVSLIEDPKHPKTIILLLEDFKNLKKANRDKNNEQIRQLLLATTNNLDIDISEDIQSTTSSISESFLEDIDLDINQNQKIRHKSLFNPQKIKRNYNPIKISFIIGVSENLNLKAGHFLIQKDRIYKDFKIHEIQWHLCDKILCGVRITFINYHLRLPLVGHFHGVRGDELVKTVLSEFEWPTQIEVAAGDDAILYLKIFTSFGNQTKIGIDKNQAVQKGATLVLRYFPKEVFLYNFFCKFNLESNHIENIRFLYIRTILY